MYREIINKKHINNINKKLFDFTTFFKSPDLLIHPVYYIDRAYFSAWYIFKYNFYIVIRYVKKATSRF